MDSTILDKIKVIFSNVLEHSDFNLTESTTTKDVNGWESSTHMMIITEVETEFDIEFELDELWSMKNVGDLVRIIALKTQ
ncbi:acyl carrier protein [Mariniflexile litorale]|uniref:Acyl carrier protein n=1 Tax=Mariniflexile litorale TaxID=3045158 RepID=A0AAU7EGI0_9FLAO|nr:acyl carrier protein [Mariniflexile sp. KMM 9835]MDQ8211523.1 acyl carrier protein [Mariniflexile sp. KMM 9835]